MPGDVLAKTLETRFEGVAAEYRSFSDPAELKGCLPTIAVVKFSWMVDHYITVLRVDNRTITVGDPLRGRENISLDEFKKRWRYTGIWVHRK